MTTTQTAPAVNLKPSARLLPKYKAALLLSFLFAGTFAVEAATVWTGPNTTFSKAASADPTQAANQDRLTPNVWLTRKSSEGIYNIKTESGFTHFFSPADTEWADGTTANYSNLSYTDWNSWAHGVHFGPPSTVGVEAVVHLRSDDIYLNIKFTGWAASASGGAFSYVRSTPAAANIHPSVSITNPINGASFIGPATVLIKATASDSDGTVTNVQFFDGATSLGRVASSPYNLSANLAVGSHTLTAKAFDNLGATTTSSAVTITVASNSPPSVFITSPTNGAHFSEPATVTIQSTASDSDGTVTNVQFFDGATSLGTRSTSPYTNTSSFPAGTHVLTAIATDNLGATNTSVPVTMIVSTPVAITLGAPEWFPPSNFQFTYTATPGLAYTIRRATPLPVWTTIRTNTATNGTMTFRDTNATAPANSYSIQLLPNP